MPLAEWRKLSTEVRASNPWWVYRLDSVELPSGERGEFHYVETPGSVLVVARSSEGRFFLVEQYRYPNDRISLEFPGGGMKRGAAAEESARDELAEEAGCAADALVDLGTFNPCNGMTSELCHVFLAEGIRPAVARRDATEDFRVTTHTREEIDDLISGQRIWDGMTLAAWMLYTRRFP